METERSRHFERTEKGSQKKEKRKKEKGSVRLIHNPAFQLPYKTLFRILHREKGSVRLIHNPAFQLPYKTLFRILHRTVIIRKI